jgi:tetratricopeptide (TPR) repeat protein
MEDLGLVSDAERMYGRFVELTGMEQPQNSLLLAAFLAKQNRLQDGLMICDRAWNNPKCPKEDIAATGVIMLRAAEPTPDQFRIVEDRLQSALGQKPPLSAQSTAVLMMALADVYDAQKQYGRAKEQYMAVLTAYPKNAFAINNLAWILALHEKRNGEAMEQINWAIELAGPLGTLLDTKGVIQMEMAKYADAIETLKSAVLENPTPARWYHLARAYYLMKNEKEAKTAWNKAKDSKLSEKALHPLELPDYRKMAEDMGKVPADVRASGR